MWGNDFFFFSSTVYLSVSLGCGSIMDIMRLQNSAWIQSELGKICIS